MVDNLTIMLEKFSGNFENCEIVKVFENIGIYRLKGLSRIAPHPLRLIYIRRTGRLYIVNSLRKWYCGRTSLFDLTSETLVHALKRLAADLNISYEELGRGRGYPGRGRVEPMDANPVPSADPPDGRL